MLPFNQWTHLTTEDFSGGRFADTLAVLPVAAVEQHGPHLPLGTDVFIMEGYLARVAALLDGAAPALFLPVQPIGLSNEHLAFKGTLTLAPETAIRVWTDVGESLHRAGCRKLVIVSSHGGNSPVIDIVARDLRARLNMLTVTVSWQRFGYPDGLFDTQEIRHGIHGGDIETSLMLAFRPDLVRMERARDFTPLSVALAERYRYLSAGRPAGLGWMAQDLHPAGAIGNAAPATAQKGEAAAVHGARAFIDLLAEVRDFELPAAEGH
ncbi:MAG: creatininase family protein [Pseudochelatococcus sp.]|jgi:creatinine amidohydrolase|uniref:creatininase family protein n=1 Tax=Pseudochelatococcus sp. TaxID=2020869 RepID=UPI003D900BF5